MESRIQILDRLSKKWGQRVNPLVENFDDFCVCFDSKAILQLVYMAMAEYSKQSRKHSNEKERDYYTDENIEELMLDSMKARWSHCFNGDKVTQRPDNFQKELKMKAEGARLMLQTICWLQSDRTDADDIFQFINKED
jgi:hypothetical protein